MMMKLFTRTVLASRNSTSDAGSGLGFGCMGMTAFYGEAMLDSKAMDLLKEVYDNGCRHFDTAEVYRTGDKYNEAVLGQFFKRIPRGSFTVATKYMPYSHDNKNDYDTVKASLQASLERLDLDYVDLYYCHRITDLKGAMEFAKSAKKLKEEGLIKEVGLSEISASWLKRVHTEACPIDAIQQEWSLLTRNLEEELVPMCRELGIPIVAYSPLARTMLASKLETAPKDWRSTLPRFQSLSANQKISDIMAEMANKYDCTPAQLALAWLFKKASQMGVTVVPIPGSTKLEHALSNMKAIQVDISDDTDMKMLEDLADQVTGARGTDGYVQAGFESQAASDEL